MSEGPITLKGFATMRLRQPDRHKAVASKGGKSAHRLGKAHQWDAEQARAAGVKGGASRWAGHKRGVEE